MVEIQFFIYQIYMATYSVINARYLTLSKILAVSNNNTHTENVTLKSLLVLSAHQELSEVRLLVCIILSPVQFFLCCCAGEHNKGCRKLCHIYILTPGRLFHHARLRTLSGMIDNDTQVVGGRQMTVFLKHRSQK